MKRIFLTFIFFCLAIVSIFSQAAAVKKWDLSLGYYGETITHPGLTAGLRYAIFENAYHAFMVQTELGGYWHPLNSAAVFIDVQPGYRLTFPFGLFFDLFAGIGYMHRFLASPTFQVANGHVTPYDHPGFPELMIPVSIGFGWDFGKGNGRPFDLALRIGGFGEYPVNHITILQPVIQIAAAFPIF